MKKVLLTATVQSHICQFHKPLAALLHENGYEIHVAAQNNLAEKNGLKLDFVDKVYDIRFARSPKSPDNLKAYKQLKKIIDSENYDVIHCNTPMGGFVTRLAARRARKKGTTVIYTAHGFHFYKGSSKASWTVIYPIEKTFARLTDKLVTINREDYALARERFKTDVYYIHGVGVNEKRYVPAAEGEKSALRKKHGFNEEQKIMLIIGELLPNKNQQMAIRMMQKVIEVYPDAVLLIAGNGPERENLENLINELDISDNVKMIGYCTNLEEYQKMIDLSVACSKREGLPLNIVESMLADNPIVATKNRGHCELVEHGVTGYLVDVDDTDSMADYVLKLLADTEQMNKMKKNCREFALQYGFEAVTQELKKVYGIE
ncbi:MAG: glycosyltransferase family 4 protein [Erysipelotrichaceae bacterium]|nr:glycosyltransferase family 4 protein [Erysipelotrichaceae bacterium]